MGSNIAWRISYEKRKNSREAYEEPKQLVKEYAGKDIPLLKDKQDGRIYHEIENQPVQVYRDIRAGLSWPSKTVPGYYCIVGERDRENQFKKYPLVLLAEGKSEELQELFNKLTDDAKMLLCEEIYVDLTEGQQCYGEAFDDHCSGTKTRGLYLQQAPWVENFYYGTALIQEWLKGQALEIGRDTILAQHLGRLPKGDLGEHPEEEYYAVNALRFVLGAFKKYPSKNEEMEDIDYGDPSQYPGYIKFH